MVPNLPSNMCSSSSVFVPIMKVNGVQNTGILINFIFHVYIHKRENSVIIFSSSWLSTSVCTHFQMLCFFVCHVCVFDSSCLFLKISIVFSLITFLDRTCQFPQKHHSLFSEPVQENKSRIEITCLCWSKTSCSWTNLNDWSSRNKNHNSDLRSVCMSDRHHQPLKFRPKRAPSTASALSDYTQPILVLSPKPDTLAFEERTWVWPNVGQTLCWPGF